MRSLTNEEDRFPCVFQHSTNRTWRIVRIRKRAYGEHVSHYLASERARLIVTILNLEKTTFDPFDSPSSNPGAFSEKKEKKEVEKLSKKSSIIHNDQVLEQNGFSCKIRREFVR